MWFAGPFAPTQRQCISLSDAARQISTNRTAHDGIAARGPWDEASPSLYAALDVLMRFGASMLRAGNAAGRVREWMGVVACGLGLDGFAVHVTLGGMTTSARHGEERATLATGIGPIGINAWRIGALEELAKEAGSGLISRELAIRLDAIEAVGLESVVTWTLTPTSTGTHLRMKQSGFRPDQQQAYPGAKGGWRQFFANLEQVLARID